MKSENHKICFRKALGLKGDKGDQGIQGIQGEVGPQGLKGDQGDIGPQGLKGDKGDQGIQGLTGETGAQGTKGDQGLPGPNIVDATTTIAPQVIGFGNLKQSALDSLVKYLSNYFQKKLTLKVSAGLFHTMIVKLDGTLWATGWNSFGQLGDGTTSNDPKATPVQIMPNVASVMAGYFHTMIVKTDGTLWATGLNDYGQLGDGTTANKSTPVQILNP